MPGWSTVQPHQYTTKTKSEREKKRPPLGEGPIKTADGGGSRN